MIRPDEAVALIMGSLGPVPSELVPLESTVGRPLSKDIHATEDLPTFDMSLMDGYAVRAGDVAEASRERPVRLSVQGVIRAGDPAGEAIQPGKTFRIMTGSRLPKGADAVIKAEHAHLEGGGTVMCSNPVRAGENIRIRGDHARSGNLLFPRGTLVRPYEVMILASMGILEIAVNRRPRVGVLVTGNELVDPQQVPPPGKIRNSNGLTIKTALSRWGIHDVRVETGRDDPDELEAGLRGMLAGSDLLLVTGGSSSGDLDLARPVLEKLGMRTIFWKVAVKPGTSLLFGIFADDPERGTARPVFSLPGNTMAVLVCLEEFVRPALEKLQGKVPRYSSYHMEGVVENRCETDEKLQQFLFCRAVGEQSGFRLRVFRPGSDSLLEKIREANAMAVSPIGKGLIEPGDTLSFRWLK